jgi:general secretion pathway protein A
MYLVHFGLKKKPFDISPDPEFLWMGEKHREGLAILKYGIIENKGFLLITGEVGTGKTALIRCIEKEIDAHAIVVTIPDPGMTLMDFYNYLAAELKMERGFRNKGEFLVGFKRLLLDAFAKYKRVLLIIDEAQRLDHSLLEEIRLLSNIDMGGKVLINIFFVGQSEFRTLLAKEENRSVRQRITVSYHIAPLSATETQHYINHRLAVAGAQREIISPEACRAVFRYSQGFPRLINIICDHSLMSAYSRGADTVDEGTIRECAEELRITIGLDIPQEPSPPAAAAARSSRPAAKLPPPPTRRGRSIWVFALCLLAFGAVWYLWGDAISDQLARLGKPGEMRAASDSPGGTGIAAEGKVPPLPVKTGPLQPPAAESPAGSVSEQGAAPKPEPGADGSGTAVASSLPPVASQTAKPSSGAPPQAAPPERTPPAAAPKETAPASTASAQKLKQPAAPAAQAAAQPFTEQEFMVYFTQSSTEVSIYAEDVLDHAVALLKAHPGAEATIEGHSDAIGNPWLNQVISESRASAVKTFMVKQGIEAQRLATAGFGSEKPIESNDTAEGRSKNRRVVVRITAGKQG